MIAAYHVDGIPIANRFDWPASHALEAFGRETDLLHAGVPSEAHDRLCGLVKENLEHLNQIRAAVLSPSQRSGPGSLNRISASLSGGSAGIRLPSGGAAG